MKVLLDENLPRPLKNFFPSGWSIFTVNDLGWQSFKNGELLQAMTRDEIGILLTADRNLRHQQNLDKYNVSVVVLICYDNRLNSLKEKIPQIVDGLKNIQPRSVVELDLR